MTISPLKLASQGINSNQELIGNLAKLMKVLATAAKELENHIKAINPTDPKYKGTNEDIARALEALQEGLTGYTDKVLATLKQKSGFEDLVFAIKLVETYLQETKSLDKSLSTLKELDTPITSHPKFKTTDTNFPAECKSSQSNIYEVVPCVRQSLSTTLNNILDQLNLTPDEVDIKSLVQESRNIISALDTISSSSSSTPKLTDVSPVVARFISHLKKARDTFKQFSRNNISLDAGEVNALKELVSNWEKITQKLQTITAKEDLSDPQANRDAIAKSIQIHDLLEVNYDSLTALVRSGDLESAGIL